MTHERTQITLHRMTEPPLHAGGTAIYEVRRNGQRIGLVGDAREFDGSHFRGRRWWSCWREEGDEHARWNTEPVYRTRREALNALLEELLRYINGKLDALYDAAKRELAEATTAEAIAAAAARVGAHEQARRIVGLPTDPEDTP